MVMKRVVAYFIDILLVTFAASMLASISYLNPQLKAYNDIYNDEYVKFYEEYKDNIKEIKDEKLLEEYKNRLEDINYKLDRKNIYGATISILLTIIYFAIFQKYNNGQTLGKRIMKIKLSNMSIFKYLIRTIILHNVWINALKIILILILSKKNYILANNVLYVLALLIETTIIIMVSMRKDNKGLHDLIVGSKVIEIPKEKEVG